MVLAYTFFAVALVSLVSFVGLFTLAFREEMLKRMVFVLVGLAIGALFGDALLHLIPEAIKSDTGEVAAGIGIMTGIFFFFVLEKFLFWHHSHGESEESRDTLVLHDHHPQAVGSLILAADFVHNILDGIIVAASFLVSTPVGIATTLAVVLHEIPQEIADFGLLIHAGWSRGRALLWNFFSALSAFLGAGLVFLIGENIEQAVPLAAAFTAGGFIYIAGSDLVPELHKINGLRHTLLQILAVAVGFGLMLLLVFIE